MFLSMHTEGTLSFFDISVICEVLTAMVPVLLPPTRRSDLSQGGQALENLEARDLARTGMQIRSDTNRLKLYSRSSVERT